MGLLTETASRGGAVPSTAKLANATSSRTQMIAEAGRTFEERYCDKYKDFDAMLNSSDLKEQLRAATTIKALENMEDALDAARSAYGESVVQASLGALNPRVLDVVRVFYPQIIAHEITDIQPLTGLYGQIFVIKPQYGGPVAGVPGVTIGNQMFQPANYPTYNNYASELSYATVGTGNASATVFTALLAPTPIRPGTLNIVAGAITGVDNGTGTITGTGISSGTINYNNGAISITFTVAPASSVPVVANWLFSSEIGQSSIRNVQFDLQLIPVQAQVYPLTFSYSVPAGLAASAHLAVDVQDVLTNIAATEIKVERDTRLIQMIAAAANHDSSLDFNASTTGIYYDKRSFYGTIEIKLDQATSLIQNQVGRGGLDFVICGYNAATVFANCRSFKAEPVRAPIGSYKIGTLRDGTISVIKSLTISANTYIFGFKGYTAGDAASVLAEWIPLYSTPLFQNPTFNNQQGLCSLYDMFVNNSNYYWYGTLTNYGA